MAIIYNKSLRKGYRDVNVDNLFESIKKSGFNRIPRDIEGIIDSYGIQVVEEDMEYEISGCIVKESGEYIIRINKYQNPRRKRFTLAHEFSHFVLHRDKIDKGEFSREEILFRSEDRSKIEKDANSLASEILIPEEEFKDFVNQGVRKVSELADLFNVSIPAVRYKAHKLGYIKEY